MIDVHALGSDGMTSRYPLSWALSSLPRYRRTEYSVMKSVEGKVGATHAKNCLKIAISEFTRRPEIVPMPILFGIERHCRFFRQAP